MRQYKFILTITDPLNTRAKDLNPEGFRKEISEVIDIYTNLFSTDEPGTPEFDKKLKEVIATASGVNSSANEHKSKHVSLELERFIYER